MKCFHVSCLLGCVTNFHMQGCSGTFIPITLKDKENFHAVTVLLFYILQNCDLQDTAYCIDVCIVHCFMTLASVDINVACCLTSLHVKHAIITDCRRQTV